MKRENPYTRLKRECQKWAVSVQYPHISHVATWVKFRDGGALQQLFIQAEMAEKMGCRLELRAGTYDDGNKLHVYAVKNPASVPYEIQ